MESHVANPITSGMCYDIDDNDNDNEHALDMFGCYVTCKVWIHFTNSLHIFLIPMLNRIKNLQPIIFTSYK